MANYDTYKEAVIAKGSTEGVVTTCDNWDGHHSIKGKFTFGDEYEMEMPLTGHGKWKECNPADYLETLESFLASGKRLVDGDLYVSASGTVLKVGDDYIHAHNMNRPSEDIDCRTYILQAAADQVETPEEKEAFDSIPNQTTIDAMNSEPEKESYNSASEAFDSIDTTPQQVESLSGSGKLHDSAFLVESDEVAMCDDIKERIGESCVVHYQFTNSNGHEMCAVEFNDGECHCVVSECLETAFEREERERDEMAKQLMIDMHGNGIFDKREWDYQKRYSLSAQQAFNLIDAGYRKQ